MQIIAISKSINFGRKIHVMLLVVSLSISSKFDAKNALMCLKNCEKYFTTYKIIACVRSSWFDEHYCIM